MPPPPDRGDGTKVYIGNLDDRTTKKDLEDFFKGHGAITDMWLARSPPGFAFVHFADPRDAEDACRELDGKDILNRRVRVEVSTGPRRKDRTRDEKCYVCGGYNHLARDCRERRRSRSPRRDRGRDRSRSPRRDRERERSRSPRRNDRDRRDDRDNRGRDDRVRDDRDREPESFRERERERSPRRRSRSPVKDSGANGDRPIDAASSDHRD